MRATCTVTGCALLMASSVLQAGEDCTKIADGKERLACFDKTYGTKQPPGQPVFEKPTEKPKSDSPGDTPPSWLESFQVRDDGNVNKVGQNPASISLARVNGKEATIAKAALIWSGPAFNNWGWQPFAS